MTDLAPGVAEAIGRLAEQGIVVFVPRGTEHMLSIEDGCLVIRSERLEVSEVVTCIGCGYSGPDLEHRCSGPVVNLN